MKGCQIDETLSRKDKDTTDFKNLTECFVFEVENVEKNSFFLKKIQFRFVSALKLMFKYQNNFATKKNRENRKRRWHSNAIVVVVVVKVFLLLLLYVIVGYSAVAVVIVLLKIFHF